MANATDPIQFAVPDISHPVMRTGTDGKPSNQLSELWYYLLMSVVGRVGGEIPTSLITGNLIDSTTPIAGAILIGDATTGQYVQGVIDPASNKISIALADGSIEIDAVEANFTLDNIGGTLNLAKGGTNASLVASVNSLVYSTASAMAFLATANNGILVTSGTGVPSISSTLPSTVMGNITTVGTITSGTWNATIIGPTYGGTGVNNGSSTITLGGSLTTSGAFASTFTMTGLTNVTFPTSGTLATTSSIPSLPLSLANGGTNASLVASNGGIFYSTASAGAILSGTITANQMLLSGSSAAPAWSTATYPATTTVNQILYSSSANVIAGLSTANNGVLITSGAGAPSISSTLPNAVQTNITVVGTITTGVWSGTAVAIAKGGTGQTTATAAFNALSPLTTKGDLIGFDGTNNIRIAAGTNTFILTADSTATAGWKWAAAGAGTVTTVSVVTANGVSGTVATATTTPAITLTLGAITPTSVNASSTVTGSNLTGTNTGDQTITLTGNVTGSGTGSFATTIAASAVTNSMLAGSIAFSKLIGTDITTVGTLTGGTWSATTIAVNKGGTGQTSYTDGQLLIGATSGNTLAKATLTAGTGIAITNGTSSITVSVPFCVTDIVTYSMCGGV